MGSESFSRAFRVLFAAPDYGVVCVCFCKEIQRFVQYGAFRGLTGCFSRAFRGLIADLFAELFAELFVGHRGCSQFAFRVLFAGTHWGVAFRGPGLAVREMGTMVRPGLEWDGPQWARPSWSHLLGLDGPHWARMGEPSVGRALGGPLFRSMGQIAVDLALGGVLAELVWRALAGPSWCPRGALEAPRGGAQTAWSCMQWEYVSELGCTEECKMSAVARRGPYLLWALPP